MIADLRRWIGGALRWVYPPAEIADSVMVQQKEALAINRMAAAENRDAANQATEAINELLLQLEARRDVR